jgi:type II secretory pathway pseudopilin PulG
MKRGPTLIQIMITISVLSAVAIVAIPNVLQSRLAANETMAVNTLKYIAAAQDDFRQELEHNEDNDDSGEYGTFSQLSGAAKTSKGRFADPPYLDERFRVKEPDGIAETSGYRFRMFLPTKERQLRDSVSTVTDEREVFWCAYAWPIEPGKTGSRVFFMKEDNLVFAIDASEVRLPVDAGAAFVGEPFASDVKVTTWMVIQ